MSHSLLTCMPQTLRPSVPEVVAAAFAIFRCFFEALLSSAYCREPTCHT